MPPARLCSVNVGLPRDVSWRGRTVFTGVFKSEAEGPRRVRRLNVDGDGQGDTAGHGGEQRAVFVYQLGSYRYWERELGRDDFVHGQFGENLTVDGLADDEVCIGDRYRIGGAVFEVTQPRVTCYRAGLRLGEPRMAALLVSHGRPGFYCRVITEGEVQAGQDIVEIADGPEHMTVAEIDALLYLPGRSRDALERARRIPALSPGWRRSFQSLAEQQSSAAPAWTGFRPLAVRDVHEESSSVRSVLLADPGGAVLPSWTAGQSITVKLLLDAGTGAVIRNYSLSNDPGSGGYRISVKREPRGVASGYLHSTLKIGDLIEVAAPRGTFVLARDDKPVVLLSAGVGVTPLLSMLHALAAAGSTRGVWWLHGARNGSEHPFADEAGSALKQLSHSTSHIFYSRPATADRWGVDYTEAGRLSAEAFTRLGLPRDAAAYLCGPAGFMNELGAGLVAYGLDPARVHTEIFGAGPALTPGIAATALTPHLPAGPPGPGPQVQFARSGLAAAWDPAYASLLELAEACDVPTRWACRTGVCHTCETALLSGSVRYEPEPLEPPGGGGILLCCAQPGESVVIDL